MPTSPALAVSPVLVPPAPATSRPVSSATRSISLSAPLPAQLLSWSLAVSLLCLAIGLVGLTQPVSTSIPLLTDTNAGDGDIVHDLSLMEMPAAPAATSAEEILPPAEVLPTIELTAMVAEMIPESVPEFETLEAPLTLEDVLEIPQAPPIDAMLTPAKPPAPRPPPQVTRSPSRPASTPSSSRSTTASSSSSSSSSSGMTGSGGSGGSGGTGSGGGSSTGYFPAPPYPATARSRGMQGTVYLNLTFNADGRVVSATVSRSSGYSYLDQTAADWARRNWRGSKGQTGTFRKPVQFRLR